VKISSLFVSKEQRLQICFGGTSSREPNELTSLLNLDRLMHDYNQRGDHVFGAISVRGQSSLITYTKKSMAINGILREGGVISGLVDDR